MTARVCTAILMVLGLNSCSGDETISGYAPEGAVWTLRDLGGMEIAATLTFPEKGRVAGQAPCNRYFATQTAPYPWFELGPIGATKMACDALRQESTFFDALSSMTLVEVVGDVLILSNEAGQSLTFDRR